MGLPPWETSESQLFAMITGANSGLGFGIATRLIDEFLTSPSTPPTKHLVLIITTRTALKTRFAISRLRGHLRKLAEYSPYATKQHKKAKEQGVEYKWWSTVQRVHFLGTEVDLCNLKSVYALADQILNGTLGTPDATTYDGLRLPAGSPGTQSYSKDIPQDRWALSEKEGSIGAMRSWGWGLSGIRIPRLDVVVWNAGIGGWTGLDWPAAIWTVLTDIIEATTYPAYKLADVGAVVKSQLGSLETGKSSGDETEPLLNAGKTQEPPLGEVFCANVFGHYILTHELMPLLSRPASPTATSGGKIIWISSVEAVPDRFSLDDIQGLKSQGPYESGKRLVDILALTSDLPSVQNASRAFFEFPETKSAKEDEKIGDNESSVLVKPKVYVAHPGVFASEILPLPWILVKFMQLAFLIARWLGSPWHPLVPYKAAIAPVWIALSDDETLERANAVHSKWGSAANRWGEERVMRTEVGGWGWDGKVGSLEGKDEGEGVVETKLGRARHAVDVTKESREDFEITGAKCWAELEALRKEWEDLLGIKQGKK